MGSHVVGEIAGNAIGTAVALAGIGKSAADKIKEDAGAQLASAGRDALNSKQEARCRWPQAELLSPQACHCSSSPDRV